MRTTTLMILVLLIINSCTSIKPSQNKSEWIKLFNGKDINDWFVKIQHHEVGENFGNTFRAEDGTIKG